MTTYTHNTDCYVPGTMCYHPVVLLYLLLLLTGSYCPCVRMLNVNNKYFTHIMLLFLSRYPGTVLHQLLHLGTGRTYSVQLSDPETDAF